MSDIAIRFDGLILAAAIAFSVLVFAILGLTTLVLSAVRKDLRNRLFSMAKMAFVQSAISLACLTAVILYLDRRSVPISSVDWIDWLALPWAALFLFAVIRLIRVRTSPGRKA